MGIRFLSESKGDVLRFLIVMAAAFVCYFAALLCLRRSTSRLPAWLIIVMAAAIQIAPYRGSPLWDTDAYRYHWDGLLLAHGVNPFQYAPGDHHLARLRDSFWPSVDYKWIRTIYPPVTQLLLAGTYFLDPTPRRVLLLAMGFNLLTLWPLMLLLRARGVDEKWLAIYAWNPLLANEFAIGGHLDPISIFLLLAALYALERRQRVGAGGLLALSVLAKTQMIFVAPLILWRTGWRGLCLFAIVAVALVLPFASVGPGNLLSGSLAYAGQWENNSGAFALLRVAFGSHAARLVTAALMLALVGWITVRRGDLLLHTGLVLGSLLLLSPAFFPWYVSWVLPFVCFYRSVTWVAIPALLLAPYVLYYDRALGFQVRLVEIPLMYLLGLGEYLWWRRRRRADGGATTRVTPSSPDNPSGL